MISICCTEQKPDFKDLSFEEYKMFSRLVYLLRKQGYQVKEAQDKAYLFVLTSSIPFNKE
jgi:hypothetical protein